MTHFPRTALMILIGAALAASLASAYVTDTAVHAPPNYNTFVPPARLGSYADPVFGTTVTRITTALSTTSADSGSMLTWIEPEYATAEAFSIDNSHFILDHISYYGLYNGNGSYVTNLPLEINTSSEPRWSRKVATLLYYHSGNQLKSYDISSKATTLLHTFSEYSSISGHGESDISYDGDHFVFASGDNSQIFEYTISTNTKSAVLNTNGNQFDSIYIAADNTITVTWLANGSNRFNGIEHFDKNMNFLGQAAHAGGHMHMSQDLDGTPVLIWTNSNDPAPVCGQNAIVKINLKSHQQTCLLSLAWSLAVHITAADNTWAFVETYNPVDIDPGSSSWVPYTNELLQIKLDGSQVRRLAHHRSRPLDSYNYEPKMTVSHDGSRAVFASNYDLQKIQSAPTNYADTYMFQTGITVPVGVFNGTSGTTTTTSGSTTTGGTTTTSTTGGTSTSTTSTTTTTVQETASNVVYAGSWYNNSNSRLSGGTAKLAMDAGSTATLSFTGIGASWIGYKDAWSGIARVYVDGVLKQTLDTYAASDTPQAVLYSATGLTNAAHKLQIYVTGTRNASSGGTWVWIDAFNVTAATTTSGTTTTSPTTTTTSPTTTTTATTTLIQQTASNVTYAGSWYTVTNVVLSGGSAKEAMDAGSTATVAFTGTGIAWIGYKDAWSGIAKVYLDGVLKATVDCYSATDAAQAKLYSITGLVSGAHALKIVATGSKNVSSGGAWVWADAFSITN